MSYPACDAEYTDIEQVDHGARHDARLDIWVAL